MCTFESTKSEESFKELGNGIVLNYTTVSAG